MNTKLPHTLLALAITLASGLSLAHEHEDGHGHDHDTEAIGQAGELAEVSQTITVKMSDAMRFTPANIQVKKGETIRFVVKNAGQLKHEMVLGTEDALKAHAEVMKKNPEMEHADPNMVTVLPGQTGEMVWQFTKAGKVNFACLQPGHYDAGMKGQVTVASARKSLTKSHAEHKH
ncbi:MAG: cupredoxin family protein [Pseudomonadota bacterium]|uniref:cupredoxin domain-containing protein n=1 Tax=Aquabacterium sp. CECT 9606 TaxID=2845822 RepID=UPI001E5EFE33|nr:cupredoxin family protein [Aquabacterium sp. CECT 9606]CAH0353345.1 hypothetical protein AQB9606_03184 [Aquabacterium sp. CECT 9606]